MGRKKKVVEIAEKAALAALVDDRLLMTKAMWLEKMDRMAMADPRKMFDAQGNVLDIQDIPDAEADLIEGIEVVENFAKVGDRAEHVGYTKRIKLASRRIILKDYGEARGWLEPDKKDGPKRVFLRRWVKEEVYHDGTNTLCIDVTPRASGNDDGAVQPADGGDGAGVEAHQGGGAETSGPVSPVSGEQQPVSILQADASLPVRRIQTRRLSDLHVPERGPNDGV